MIDHLALPALPELEIASENGIPKHDRFLSAAAGYSERPTLRL
jgi:hypothetical protein